MLPVAQRMATRPATRLILSNPGRDMNVTEALNTTAAWGAQGEIVNKEPKWLDQRKGAYDKAYRGPDCEHRSRTS